MYFRKKDPEVLVVGAGPVGMFTALCLADRGLDFRIVDRDVRTAAHSYALALHPRSTEMLASFGLDERELAAGRRIETIAFYDDTKWRASVRLTELPGVHPYLLVLRQSRIEQLLHGLLSDAHRKVEWTRRVSSVRTDDDGLHVTLDHLDKVSSGYAVSVPEWQVVHRKTIHPSFVIGADGAESGVRTAFGARMRDAGAPSIFSVFEFESDYPLPHEMRVVLGEKAMSVLWPLPDGKVRWSFEMPDAAPPADALREKSRYVMQTDPEREASLGMDALLRLIEERAPWFDTEPGEITWSTSVKFDRKLATRFAGPRFALCGDAAHVTGPVGVQSMNLGFAEARDIVERLARVLKDGASANLLNEYDERWRREWEVLAGLQGDLVPRGTADPWVAWNRFRIRACLPGWGDGFRLLANQLGLEVKREAPAEIT